MRIALTFDSGGPAEYSVDSAQTYKTVGGTKLGSDLEAGDQIQVLYSWLTIDTVTPAEE